MVRSRLRNKSLKLKSMESMEVYKKQRNYCVSLLRKAKKDYYEQLHVETIIDNKKFWKHVKPFFSDKTPPNSKITLIEANEIISDSTECDDILNNFFSDAAINLGVDRELFTNASYASDPITVAIEKYNNHPSIMKLNQEGFPSSYFSFEYISENDMLMVIQNLNSSKAYQKDNIPPKLLKKNKDISSKLLTNDVCRCINNGLFLNNHKSADITPIFKKDDRLLKINYRPVSILPTLSKIYEKILYMQIYEFFNNIFSKYLCGFRKCHSTQHCLLFMLENLRRYLDKGFKTGILLTDLSKAFDSISHDLLLTKLDAYGFTKNSLNLINDYLTGRRQRTKISDRFSSWRDIICCLPQRSILDLCYLIYTLMIFLCSQIIFKLQIMPTIVPPSNLVEP